MEQKIIEDFLWIDIFKNDILSVTLPVVVMIIVFRIVALLFKKSRKIKGLCIYDEGTIIWICGYYVMCIFFSHRKFFTDHKCIYRIYFFV